MAVLQSSDRWFGVTHAGDRQQAQQRLLRRVENGHYPPSLREAIRTMGGA